MKKIITTSLLCFCLKFSFAQNIGIGTSTPNPSAILEVSSTNRGFLPPRLTFAQRNAILNPPQGLIVYCTDCGSNGGEPQYYNGTDWKNMIGGTAQEGPFNPPSVVIGSQVWTTQNLNVTRYRNGDAIPQVTDSVQWGSLTTGAWCWYNNDSATFAATYGRLYNWYAVNDPRGLAPMGWRIPNNSDWNKLVKYLMPSSDTNQCNACIQISNIGGALKETGTINWLSPNTGANNLSGFTALPGGYRGLDGYFYENRTNGYLWLATPLFSDNRFAWSIYLTNADYIASRTYFYYKGMGFSVRIIKD